MVKTLFTTGKRSLIRDKIYDTQYRSISLCVPISQYANNQPMKIEEKGSDSPRERIEVSWWEGDEERSFTGNVETLFTKACRINQHCAGHAEYRANYSLN